MKILARIIAKSKSDNKDDEQDVHDAQCAACRMKPIRHVDRYRCLECSAGYDLCGRCFERREETERHSNGHAMIHFKLPNEFLRVHVNDIDQEISLNKLKHIKTLQYEKHDGIQCDGNCRQKNFVGLRFKCDICPNYNLCETCAIKKHVCTKMHQRDHPIILTSNRVMPKIDPQDIEMGEVLGRGASSSFRYYRIYFGDLYPDDMGINIVRLRVSKRQYLLLLRARLELERQLPKCDLFTLQASDE